MNSRLRRRLERLEENNVDQLSESDGRWKIGATEVAAYLECPPDGFVDLVSKEVCNAYWQCCDNCRAAFLPKDAIVCSRCGSELDGWLMKSPKDLCLDAASALRAAIDLSADMRSAYRKLKDHQLSVIATIRSFIGGEAT